MYTAVDIIIVPPVIEMCKISRISKELIRDVVTYETSIVTVRDRAQFYFHNQTHLACASLAHNQIQLKLGLTTFP